ncbi:transglutaminase TgpA family protein [Lentzea sp. NPDC054927]
MSRRWRALAPSPALVEVTLALVASAAGALVYHDFFATPGYLPTLGLACLVGGVSAVPGHRRAWATPVLAVAGLALVMVFGVFRGASSEVLDGMRGSWNRLLAVVVPADPWGELLVVPTLVMWAAAFTSVVLVLRTRNVPTPVVPPLAGFLFALFVVGNQAGGHAIATVVFLAAALALIALRAYRAIGTGTVQVEWQSSRSAGALAAVGLMVAASALIGVVGGHVQPVVSGEHRFDVRDVLAPPVTNTDTLTPLALLKSQLGDEPARELFTVRLDLDAFTQVDRIRTAALDVFDGTTWTSEDTYRIAGSHLTGDPALTLGKQVKAHIELKDLAGPHLPVIGWPSRLEATGGNRGMLGFDPNSGVLVSTAPKLQGLSYDVTGEVSVRDEGLALAATTPGPSKPLPDGMPQAVRDIVTSPSTFTGYNRLVDLENFFRTLSLRLDGPPGHSYAAIARLLTDGDDGRGYAEQHAAAFTLVARAMGFPARVAVGYRLRDFRGGAFQVSTADAHAWSEVHFVGYGWVTFEPSGSEYAGTPTQPAEAPRVVPPQPAPPATAPTEVPPAASRLSETTDGQGFGWDSVRDGTVLIAAAAVLLVLVLCGFVVIAKAHRRRRRRQDPFLAARVLGAWQEQVDRLTERGVTPPVSLTFHEVAQHVRGALGDAAALIEASADLATTAVYAPECLDESDAAEAWRLVAALRDRLHPRRVSAARLRAAMDPRPLWTVWVTARQRRQAGESLEVGRYR